MSRGVDEDHTGTATTVEATRFLWSDLKDGRRQPMSDDRISMAHPNDLEGRAQHSGWTDPPCGTTLVGHLRPQQQSVTCLFLASFGRARRTLSTNRATQGWQGRHQNRDVPQNASNGVHIAVRVTLPPNNCNV